MPIPDNRSQGRDSWALKCKALQGSVDPSKNTGGCFQEFVDFVDFVDHTRKGQICLKLLRWWDLVGRGLEHPGIAEGVTPQSPDW